MDDRIQQFRYFLKDSIRKAIDFSVTDQSRGVPPPPVQKAVSKGASLVDLTPPGRLRRLARADLFSVMDRRRSHRSFLPDAVSLDQLSFLLWATQGVRDVRGQAATLRIVPSAGARHALETYLCVRAVGELAPGLYRYLPLDHRLCRERDGEDLHTDLMQACFNQGFVGEAAVTFAWTTVPYRMEWRYGLAAHRVIALDAGHVCQNLYLACGAIGCGTCAVGAYDQSAVDSLLGVDGIDEFAIYLAPVGRIAVG